MPGAILVPDLTAVLAQAGLTAPKEADFSPGVPTTGLVEIWRATTGLTLVDGKVSTWEGFGGLLAQQANATKRPLGSAAGVAFSGTGDYLTTPIAPDTAGYLVAKVKRATAATSAFTAIAGEHAKVNAPQQMLSLGFSSGDQVAAFLGDNTPANFAGTTTVGNGITTVIGLGWNSATGSAVLRRDGTQEKSRTFNTATGGVAAGVGNRPLWMGGANAFNGFQNESGDTLIALAIYSGVLDDTARAAIDAAMAAL